jgi:primosomal protein N' (replication factor Y)
VIIQTFQPENYAIQYAAAQDFSGFYQRELPNAAS